MFKSLAALNVKMFDKLNHSHSSSCWPCNVAHIIVRVRHAIFCSLSLIYTY